MNRKKVVNIKDRINIDSQYVDIIQSLKFGLHRYKVVSEFGTIEDIWFIALKDRKTGVVLELTPYTKILRHTERSIDTRRSNTVKAWGTFVCMFLNYILIDNYDKFKIDDIRNINIGHGNHFLEAYAKGEVGSKNKTLDSVESVVIKLCKLYSIIKSIYKKDAKKIHGHKWKIIEGNKRYYNSPFKIKASNTRATFEVFRDMTSDIFDCLLKLSKIHYPELTFAIALQAYGGLRPGEICNVRQMICPHGTGIKYQKIGSKLNSFSINLNEKYDMRSDGVDVGGIKRRRNQKIYPTFLPIIKELYEEHLKILEQYDFNDGYYPMFIGRNGKALTVKSYRDKMHRLVNKHLKKELLESDNPYFRHYGELLTQKKLSPHFLRHYFTVKLVLDNLTPHEIATWRGDRSLDTSLIYCANKEELINAIRDINTKIVEEILRGVEND